MANDGMEQLRALLAEHPELHDRIDGSIDMT